MVRNLLRAGHEVAVFARRPAAMAEAVAAGAVACGSPAQAAAGADAVITMVTAGPDVEAVALGAGGVIEGAAAGAVLIDMSTIPPRTVRRVAARLAERGVHMLDAPVSGGVPGARAGSLAIMVGGEAAVLERMRPLLAALGRTIVHIGPQGAGQVAKACNQMIMVSAIEAVAEALRLANAHGLDAAAVVAALAGGSAGSRVLELFGAKMARRDFAPLVEARLHHKDFGIVLDEAHGLGAPLPVAAQVWQQLNSLMAQGWHQQDTGSLLRVLEAAGR